MFIGARYSDGRAGGFDPHERLRDLDIDGIDAVFLYPSLGLMASGIGDPRLAAAIARAYNRWVVDYCSVAPDRLYGVAMLPMQDVDLAVKELEFASRETGLKAAFARPSPYAGRVLSDLANEPVWSTAAELDMSIGIYGTAGGTPVGLDRIPPGPGARHIAAHTLEMMLGALNLIWGGVCERHPSLRFAFLEAGGGWMAAWVDRMDRVFEKNALFNFNETHLSMPPSEYFRRQCWISFEPNESTLAYLVDYLGPDRILWATDYPHADGYFPGAPEMIRKLLPRPELESILGEGARSFVQL